MGTQMIIIVVIRIIKEMEKIKMIKIKLILMEIQQIKMLKIKPLTIIPIRISLQAKTAQP